MMKKSYVCPCVTIDNMDDNELICASESITSDVGIDYGGVDEDGTINVESRRYSERNDDVED